MNRGLFNCIVCFFLLCLPLISAADTLTKTITLYRQAEKNESAPQALEITKQEALHQALNEIVGQYLEHHTEVETKKLIQDELINRLRRTAQLEIQNNPSRTFYENQGKVRVTLKVVIDPDNLKKLAKDLQSEINKTHFGRIELNCSLPGRLFIDSRFQDTVKEDHILILTRIPVGDHTLQLESFGKGILWENKVQLAEKRTIWSEKCTVEENRTVRVSANPELDPNRIIGPLSGMEFIRIPPGRFLMGSKLGEEGREDDESPQHLVMVKQFYMTTTELTQRQWWEVMLSNPSMLQDPELPLERVSWENAQMFLRKLNAWDPGRDYRLPTEAEWEYACRAGTLTRFANGDKNSEMKKMAWFKGNAGGHTHTVGEKEPNAFGLYDMHGNVYEWCEGKYHHSYVGAPADGSAWIDGKSWEHIVRGGSYRSEPRHCRSAYRLKDPDYQSEVIGLRLVRKR